MNFKKLFTTIMLICMLVACHATPPKTQIVSHDPILDRRGGVFLLVDVCIQRDEIGDSDDYFVINEARDAAQAALTMLREYVQDRAIPIRAELIPFICGARQENQKSTIRAADSLDDPVRDAKQPLCINESIRDDPDYVKALTVVSTYAFERAAVSCKEELASRISAEEFRSAADMIKNRTQASSLLFLGVLGNSRSAAKVAAQNIGGFFVGLGTTVLTAGLGTGYAYMFVPGHQIDGRVIESALIDFESGELTWSNAVKVGGDPLKPEEWSNPEPFNLLLRDLMFQTASDQ